MERRCYTYGASMLYVWSVGVIRMEHRWERAGKTEILEEKLAHVPLSSPQIPHGLAWD
jgi:hypothetical protein